MAKEPETKSAPVCENCGEPAISHTSNVSGGKLQIRHLCNSCADAKVAQKRETKQRRGQGVVFILVGAFILINSVLADHLQLGRSEGFGWRQMLGFGLAVLLFLLGALIRVPTLVVSGLIIGGIALLADVLQFGSHPGFGIQQIAGTILGLAMAIGGLLFARRRR